MKGFAEADHVFEDTFRFQKVQHYSLEAHNNIAYYDGEKLTVWASCQDPFTLRDHLSGIFRLPLSRIRVIVPYVGGGYGGKLYVKAEPISAALTWMTRRPVKLQLSINESFKTITRHPARVTIKTGVSKDGRLIARDCQVYMALLKFLFERHEKGTSTRRHQSVIYESPEAVGPQCRNANCVTLNEPVSTRRRFQILSPEEGGAWVVACLYCDHRNKVQYIGNAKSKRYSSFDPSLITSLREWLKAGELAIFDTIKEAEELGYEPIKSGPQRILLNESEIEQALVDIAGQILRDCQNPDRLLILGVRSVGAQLAQRLAQEVEKRCQRRLELGEIEIFGAGEELRRVSPADPDAGPLNLKDREVILVDDVLYTGRTVKSALSIIFRSGRPQSVRLAVLIDRGHREVPVRPNYVGKNIPTAENERVRVKLRGLDQENRDHAVLYSIDHAPSP